MKWKFWDVPKSNETKTIQTPQVWLVRWHRRFGEYSHSTEMCAEAFLSEPEANEFAAALRAAYRLLRHTSGTDVWVDPQNIASTGDRS